MPSPDDDEELLRRTFEAAQIAHGIRTTAAQRAYAVFGIEDEGGRRVSLTAEIVDQSLRIVAHDVLKKDPLAGDLALFNEVNRDWAMGRCYYEFGERAYVAAVALPVWPSPPRAAALIEYLHQVTGAVPYLAQYDIPQTTIPAADPPVSLDDLERRLLEIRVTGRRSAGGDSLDAQLDAPSGKRLHAQFLIVPGSLLVVRGRHLGTAVPPSDEAWRHLHERNARLGCGKVLMLPDGVLHSELALPLALFPLDADLLRVALERTVSALEENDGSLP